MTTMSYDLKQKAKNIASLLTEKSRISTEEKKEDFFYSVRTYIERVLTNDYIELQMRTLGRGSPDVEGSRYYYREKQHLKNSIPEINKKLETIVQGKNSEEKLAIIEKTCKSGKDLYGIIGVIDLLSRKYSSEEYKPVLKEISKYTMGDSMTVQCMMMVTSGQSQRIVELSRR